MHRYIEDLLKNSKIPLIAVVFIISLTGYALMGGLFPIVDFVTLRLFDGTQGFVPISTQFTPGFLSSLSIALLFSSPLWSFAIWKIVIPNSRIGLLVFCLGLLLIILGFVFVYYLYIPLFLKLMSYYSTDHVYFYSLPQARDFIVKSFVSFIFAFQIFPITLHFRKNNSRSLMYSILIRGLLLIISTYLGSLLTPPDVISTLLFMLTVMVCFELARGIRRRVVIEQGSLHRIL